MSQSTTKLRASCENNHLLTFLPLSFPANALVGWIYLEATKQGSPDQSRLPLSLDMEQGAELGEVSEGGEEI